MPALPFAPTLRSYRRDSVCHRRRRRSSASTNNPVTRSLPPPMNQSPYITKWIAASRPEKPHTASFQCPHHLFSWASPAQPPLPPCPPARRSAVGGHWVSPDSPARWGDRHQAVAKGPDRP